jgi:hypothetical protein
MTHGFGAEARNYRHGHKPADGASSEYIAWLNMKARCYNPDHNRFHRYGARGIKVCDKWRDDFEAFLKDVGPKPEGKFSLDRHPNNLGDYEPGNVRWATDLQQQNNRPGNKMIEFRGEVHTQAEWERIKGLKRGYLYNRLSRGWSLERALTEPMR